MLLAPVCSLFLQETMTLSAVLSTSDNSSHDPFEPWMCHGHFTQVLLGLHLGGQLAVTESLLCLRKDVSQLLLSSTFGMLQMWQERIWKSWWHICPLGLSERTVVFWSLSQQLCSNQYVIEHSTALYFPIWPMVEDRKDIFCKLKLMVMKKVLMLPLCISFFLAFPSVFFFFEGIFSKPI